MTLGSSSPSGLECLAWYSAERLEICKALHEVTGDWQIAKPLQSSLFAETIESYVVDRFFSRPDLCKMQACLELLLRSIESENPASFASELLEEGDTPERYLFLRIVKREIRAVGQEIALHLSPEITLSRQDSTIWHHTVSVVGRPPTGSQFSKMKKLWELNMYKQIYQTLSEKMANNRFDCSEIVVCPLYEEQLPPRLISIVGRTLDRLVDIYKWVPWT